MSITPESISRFKKEKFLRGLSEDDFRDLVLRPVYLKTGFRDGRDFCGVDENGKDCLFVEINKLDQKLIYVVQTKKGTINMTKDASSNIVSCITQLRTALATKITLIATKEKIFPNFAMLCASGKINEKARKHICDEVGDSRLLFHDVDDLIPMIDRLYPELWYGIDANKMPYLRNLKSILTQYAENIVLSDSVSAGQKASAAANELYVPLKLCFSTFTIKRSRGQAIREPKMEELPVEAIINYKKTKILILGEAGAGKSTILRRIGLVLCEQSVSLAKQLIIPILLKAIDISKSQYKLIEICAEETKKVGATKSASFSVEDLTRGNVIVLIDALDEVFDESDRKRTLEIIEEFSSVYPKCKIILTSRDYTYLKDLKSLASYEDFRITNFSISQAKTMIEKLIKGKTVSKEIMQEMVRRIQGVHGVELSPLLVRVFVSTVDIARKDIPANITELFKKYTEMMLGRWDLSKGLNQQFQFPVKDFLLKTLAYKMHTSGATNILKNECVEIFSDELKKVGMKSEEIDSLVNEIIHRSNLFRCFDGKIEFRHLLLQEFFAGRGIPSSDLISSLITNQWWQRGIIFYFGENPNNCKPLYQVIDQSTGLSSQDKFQVSVTMGLSLQACYLVSVVTKLEFLKWVISGLSEVKKDLLGIDESGSENYPLTKFILYYLFGRDCVAFDILGEYKETITTELIEQERDDVKKEMLTFWLIVGLIECGSVSDAEKLLKKFHPKDNRLLLALHLGCYFLENLRISSEEQKETARRMCILIIPRIKHLRLKLIDEFKSELLEMQQGKIKALENNQ